ncbi:hypothetical protein BCU68_11685 [Vibrio sp. 10N.286.49.B3]|uniref:LysR family transcriptional regulator n=1 Tax=Vibrio sp. 10N.286.49.B3 TaxID=1880855 RepID=UPI000C8147F9|nr:LysR family transcriptional regulator [Vibrio sp. 10N.286.49.B3]PMH44804.1 hypothetical protein BCU68_11685 [Vibrio sp. 10N.286.49.B3]
MLKQLQDFHYFDAIVKVGSILGAAETLAISPTALNRRVLALEQALGVALFEREARGVRLSTAGQYFYNYAKTQINEFECFKSQLADLSGERRGHIKIAASQALLTTFLPKQIACYRERYPDVTFTVYRRDSQDAETSLHELDADIAIVFEPYSMTGIDTLHSQHQDIYALMRDGHTLANYDKVKMSDCLDYPLAMPDRRTGISRIMHLDAHKSFYKLTPYVCSDSFEFLRHYCVYENCISFQLSIGLPDNLAAMGLIAVPLDRGSRQGGHLHVVQLRGRVLPVATTKFCQQVVTALQP